VPENESFRQPGLNLQIARAYLAASDPTYAQRTWQTVMDQFQTNGKDATRIRYVRAMKSKAFDGLRGKKMIETTAEDFLAVLKDRQVSVSHFLKRIHNLALSFGLAGVAGSGPAILAQTAIQTQTQHYAGGTSGDPGSRA